MNAVEDGGGDPRRARRGAAIVFAVALVVRLLYLWSIRDIPFFDAPAVDGAYYDRWAQRIASGEWFGGEVYFLAPAYPYFLAAIYAMFGRDLTLVHGLQMVLGAASCGMVYSAGRRFFSRGAGLVAGMILAVYPPMIFYDGLFHKAGLLLFLTAWFLLLLSSALDSYTWKRWAFCGLLGGLLALTQENMLILFVVVPAWIVLSAATVESRPRARAAIAFGLGMGGPLLLTAVRNFAVGSVFALTTSNVGQNFYIGNNPGADGLYAPLVAGHQNPAQERDDAVRLAAQAKGHDVTPGEASAFWLARGLDFVRKQPAAWTALLGRKLLLTWNRFEAPDADALTVYAAWSGWFDVPARMLHFGTLAPLGLAGLVLTMHRARPTALLAALLFALTLAIALFFVFGRYRLPLVPILALFAGAGAVEAIRLIRTAQWRKLAPAVGVLAVFGAATNWPVVDERAYHSIGLVNLGSVLAQQDRLDDAAEYFERALAAYADNALAHYQWGLAEQRRGRSSDAESHFVRATVIEPDLADAHLALARLLAGAGRTDEAVARYREAVRLRSDDSTAREELNRLIESPATTPAPPADEFESLLLAATTALQEGRFTEAMTGFTQAARIRPQDARPPMGQAASLIAARRENEALPHLRRVVELDPARADAHSEIGRILADGGEFTAAIDHYQKALTIDPSSISTHYNLATAFASLGRFAEAVDAMQACLVHARSADRSDLIPRIEDRLARLRAERDRR